MKRFAAAIIIVALSATSAPAQKPAGITCAIVRQTVKQWGIVAARSFADRYMTGEQIAQAQRCLKWGKRRIRSRNDGS